MQEYVAGFLFDDVGDSVALILKNRPVWQAGLFNAIGGKVEIGESAEAAMWREFVEEAGVETDWEHRFNLKGDQFVVHFFTQFSSECLKGVWSNTDETISIHSTSNLPANLIPNLKWIIPMLLDRTIQVPKTIKDIGGN